MANDALAANLRKDFAYGYRNREDVATLAPNVLVSGSKNVLTNTYKRVGNRRGYTLDGQRGTANTGYGIYGSYDWRSHLGYERILRAGGNSSGTNGAVQFRYVASAGEKYKTNTFTAGQVYWVDIYNTAGSTFNACRFWEFTNEQLDMILWVDGTSNIFMWTGGVATVASTTVDTITKSGTGTWATSGFLTGATYSRKVTINGNEYSYTGGAGTDTLTGVTPDPRGEPNNSLAVQTVVVFPNSGITAIPAAFKNTLISNLNNQIYLTASNDNSVYVSQVNSFVNFSFASPRVTGTGAIITLDGVPSAMQQQSDSMFISAGRDYWYYIKFALSDTGTNETLSILPIKTTAGQAAKTQGLTTKIKNLITFVSNEPQVNTLGIVENYFDDAQVEDISFPIVHDIEGADFTNGQILYHQKYVYLTAPNDGVTYIYNMTNDVVDPTITAADSHYWEAPQTFPIARMSIIGGELYGHSYNDVNTFKLFDGYSDDGKPYKSLALFAYDNYGDRTATKSSNELFIEGYKSQTTELTAYLRRNLNGPVAKWTWGILPSANIVPIVDDASIGKISIGKVPIGGSLESISDTPKFRLVQTFNRTPFFEEQPGFGTEGVGQWWEIVSFSTNATNTTEGQASIYDPPLIS